MSEKNVKCKWTIGDALHNYKGLRLPRAQAARDAPPVRRAAEGSSSGSSSSSSSSSSGNSNSSSSSSSHSNLEGMQHIMQRPDAVRHAQHEHRLVVTWLSLLLFVLVVVVVIVVILEVIVVVVVVVIAQRQHRLVVTCSKLNSDLDGMQQTKLRPRKHAAN